LSDKFGRIDKLISNSRTIFCSNYEWSN